MSRALLKQVNPRMLAFLLVSVFLLMLVASYLYILKRPVQEMRQAKQTLALLESELQTGVPLDSQIQTFQNSVADLNKQLHGGGKNLPINQMIAFVIGRLDSISVSHNVKLISVEPRGAEKIFLFQEMPFHLVVIGNYFKLFDWLNQVERELGPFAVQEFEITPEPDSTMRRFTLTLVFYHFAEKP
jgi:Tfp pilus assembly protein PilO